MTDVSGKFMMPSGSRPFRAPSQPSRTFCLNSLCTASIREIDSFITHWQLQHFLSIFIPFDPFHLDALLFLACAFLKRSTMSQQPEDAICGTKYLFHLRNQPHKIPAIPNRGVTELLVVALAMQVELEAGNVMQNIREIAILSSELFSLNTSDVDTTYPILFLHEFVVSKFRPGDPAQPLDELIEFSRVATKRRPDLLEGRMTFARSLVYRYSMTCENHDYEEATSMLDEIIAYISPGNSQDEYFRSQATILVITLSGMRSAFYHTPEYLEEVIYRARTCFNSSSYNEHFPPELLEATAKERFRHFGPIEGVESVSESSCKSLAEAISQISPEIREFTQRLGRMEDMLSGIRIKDNATEIDEGVEIARSILVPDDHCTSILMCFGRILFEAFLRTTKIEYLNESISVHRQLNSTSFSQGMRFTALPLLSLFLFARSLFFPGYRTQDLDESLELYSQYVGSTHASLPDRFRCACEWALVAQFTRHTSVSTAYATALSLMQDTVPFSPTLQLQHVTLAIARDITQSLPLDYASYRVDQNQLEEAIEVLEKGRALLWSEMRHLRTSIDQLLEVDSELGHKFASVNRDLEELTKSVPPSHKLSMDDGTADGLRAVDPFGRLVLEQRRLLKERAKLISKIQGLPGFDSFLTSPSFDTLQSAASSGPVIIINHSLWRSDILIILLDMPPSLISTPRDFFRRANALKDKLSDSRRNSGLDSSHYEKTLAFVLDQLYELVGKPVIDRLRQLQAPEQSRIWWCPTSVFCSLPLHAMGPIPSDDGESRYFLDLYICSYTPTLSALIQSRHHNSGVRFSGRPPLLLVAQPDSLPNVRGEIQVVQALDTKLRVSSQKPQHQRQSSMDFITTDSFTLRATAHWRLESHSRLDSSSMETHA